MTTAAPPLDDFNPDTPIGQVHKPNGGYSPMIEVARIRAYGETVRFYHRCMWSCGSADTLSLVRFSRDGLPEGQNVSASYLGGMIDAAELAGIGFETATDYLRRGHNLFEDSFFPTPLLIAMSRAACAADDSEDAA